MIIFSKSELIKMNKCIFACLVIAIFYSPVFSTESIDSKVIVGAGAHFSWLVFDQLQSELEAMSGRKLELYGKGSMLGVGCNAGIKAALKSKKDAESFGFICCPLSQKEIKEKIL